jgi:hypothetical protein
MEIQKTDLNKSPLLVGVINRDYTKGLGSSVNSQPSPGPTPSPDNKANPQPGAAPGAQPNFQKPGPEVTPGDNTKGFQFDEETANPSDLSEGEPGPGLNVPPGAARTFANTIGNMVQLYLPQAAYGYAKIDMDNILINVEKGVLTSNWIEVFEKINSNTEEALKISDESIKMWKAAFQHWLEYQNIKAANPNTEMAVATGALLTEMGIKVYACRKENKGYVKEAIENCNPDSVIKKPTETIINQQENEHKRAA